MYFCRGHCYVVLDRRSRRLRSHDKIGCKDMVILVFTFLRATKSRFINFSQKNLSQRTQQTLLTPKNSIHMKITRFEDIKAWQEARKLVNLIYDIIKTNAQFKKDFRFINQIQAAAVSVMSNTCPVK